jgi:APA family basic amino acid/polyamine antiporter
MQPYYDIDADTPFSMAFTAIGMGWNKSIVAFGALKGITTVMLMNTMEHVRYLTNITGPTWHRTPCPVVASTRWGTRVDAPNAMIPIRVVD